MSAFKLIAGIILDVVIFGVPLFLPAGTLRWPRAWVFLGVVFIGAIASIVSLFHASGGLLAERFRPPIQKGQPFADKVLIVLLIAAFVGLLVFTSLDVFRFHLMAEPGFLVSALGLVLLAAGWWIMTLALKENAFAAPVVKYQEERQQRVIDSGVYSVVRHPMYAGGIPLFIGMPLWLGSYAGAMLAVVPIGLLVLRIFFEERFLRRNLAGYAAYTERVRYRLIPFLW